VQFFAKVFTVFCEKRREQVKVSGEMGFLDRLFLARFQTTLLSQAAAIASTAKKISPGVLKSRTYLAIDRNKIKL
jgi:hypothetical protein